MPNLLKRYFKDHHINTYIHAYTHTHTHSMNPLWCHKDSGLWIVSQRYKSTNSRCKIPQKVYNNIINHLHT